MDPWSSAEHCRDLDWQEEAETSSFKSFATGTNEDLVQKHGLQSLEGSLFRLGADVLEDIRTGQVPPPPPPVCTTGPYLHEPPAGQGPSVSANVLGWAQETRPTEEPWPDSGATDP